MNATLAQVPRSQLIERAQSYQTTLQNNPPIPFADTVAQGQADTSFFLQSMERYQEPTLGEVLARVRGEETVYRENAQTANITRYASAAVGTGALLASAFGYLPPAVAFPVALVSCATLIGAGVRAAVAEGNANDRASFGSMLQAVGQQITGVQDTPPAPPAPPAPAPEPEQPPAQS